MQVAIECKVTSLWIFLLLLLLYSLNTSCSQGEYSLLYTRIWIFMVLLKYSIDIKICNFDAHDKHFKRKNSVKCPSDGYPMSIRWPSDVIWCERAMRNVIILMKISSLADFVL